MLSVLGHDSVNALIEAVVPADLRTDRPLVLPEPSHAIRKLLETQAALAGLKLNIAYEVSSVSAILELVRSGHGHAVLAPSAIAASGQAAAFRMRPLAESVLRSTLCMAVSAHKPATPLLKQATRLLRELVVSGVGAAGARP